MSNEAADPATQDSDYIPNMAENREILEKEVCDLYKALPPDRKELLLKTISMIAKQKMRQWISEPGAGQL